MNLLILAGMCAALLAILWLAQAAAVRWAGDGRKWALPLGHGSRSPKVRGVMKATLGIGIITLLFAYPLAIGRDPLVYHVDKLVLAPWRLGLGLMLTVLATLAAVFAVSVGVGWVRLERRHGSRKILGKVAKGVLIPLPLTLMEEPFFRGLLLEQLAAAMPPAGAVVVSAAVFAAAHFLRHQKYKLSAAVGLFYTGLVLGSAYLLAGHNYLVPIALHAGGVLFIQVTRPVSCYLGPAWLVGRSSYPIAGLLNMAAVTSAILLMTL